MRFGTRLAVFLVTVLIGVQALTGAVAYYVSRGQLVEQGQRELAKSAALFDRQLKLISERVGDGVTVLALDYPLREAIAHQDMTTVESALRNHGDRVGAQRMQLVGLEGSVLADTGRSAAKRHRFGFPRLLDDAAADGIATGMAVFDGKFSWIIVVPVSAPVTIAYVAASVPIDNALVSELRSLSALSTSIGLVAPKGAHPILLAQAGKFDPIHDWRAMRANDAAKSYAAVERDHLTLAMRLNTTAGSSPVFAVFAYPLAEALAPYNSVFLPLLAVFFVGLVAAVLGAIAIARNVSRPIEQLSRHAEKIEGGDYTAPAPIEGMGEVKHLSLALGAMARAIEERRAALEASRNEALRANNAKSEFLANMSHEIRTPLNAVLGLAGVLIDSPLNDEQRRQVVLIKESGDNLLELLNDILDLSKLDAGQIELENSTFDAPTLTRDTVDLLHARAEQQGVELTVELASGFPSSVTGDPSRLRQVLINLVGNAIKFTHKGSVKVLMTATMQDDDRATVEWSVTDTGIGIPAERVGSLFQEFVQADNSISRRFGGTGLGLAISKRLVDRMGGTIGVTSVAGHGSTFKFHVPLAISSAPAAAMLRQAAPAQDLAAFVAARGRGVRILVVEDNVTNQFVARCILKADGVHVDVAANGHEAIDAVTRHHYDLVFMDVQMPEMDGLTATRHIRARGGRCAEMPIIAFSANAYVSDIEACVSAGMNGHIAKPVQKDILCGAVIDVLSGRSCGAGVAPASEGADAPEFDRRSVDALVEGLTMEVVEELLTSFVSDTKTKIESLPELLDNYERLTIEVHALKSAGAQVGAMQLSRLAAVLEKRTLAREPVGQDELIALKTALDGYGAGLREFIQATS